MSSYKFVNKHIIHTNIYLKYKNPMDWRWMLYAMPLLFLENSLTVRPASTWRGLQTLFLGLCVQALPRGACKRPILSHLQFATCWGVLNRSCTVYENLNKSVNNVFSLLDTFVVSPVLHCGLSQACSSGKVWLLDRRSNNWNSLFI